MDMHKAATVRGDGIGPETQCVIKAGGVPLCWEEARMGKPARRLLGSEAAASHLRRDADSGGQLNGAFDLHVHCAPDVRPRKMTAVELARAARAAGMRGLLIKSHHVPTTMLAASLREIIPDLHVCGGLALNEAVGGFNPGAVEMALRMGAVEIWMPTLSARQECAHRGRPGSGLTIYDTQDRILGALKEILRLVAEADAILGTGHLAPHETRDLLFAARDAGVSKFLITHPEIGFINMPVDLQREISGPGVFFERCYVRPGFALSWDGLASVIRQVGVDTTVLATDLGQPENPDPTSGLEEMRRQLAQRGFTASELKRMMCRNPAILLGLGEDI
jgi:hypothetical protein